MLNKKTTQNLKDTRIYFNNIAEVAHLPHTSDTLFSIATGKMFGVTIKKMYTYAYNTF